MLRGVAKEHQRANFSAVFGIIGFVNVPITFLAIRLWRSIHPVLITSRGINISTPMKHTLALTFLAFCLLFFCLLKSRIRLEKTRMDTEMVSALVEEKFYSNRA
jgi:heme exporter protein C